ncbi:hypothetical protein L2719_14960 [Shewanella schlegeliana]|uniref:Uncharacterized protein n=1 Tax=Shewanella schlegeliana TaxID=190308 RepID=A0ABS1T026_9GAMM|nr:hypothetical protein [Shewanella schlegeliana]MBL4914128.1 hypothetical protein [Shewanella schlegeliana]MCL1110835.1 hypothetical protein [Shewanella schlegeliana]GIU36326.1 hypothetical protein TUM4433_34910 [Shewanella schlegeliana]
MEVKLSQKAQAELGTLMVNTPDLIHLLSLLPKENLSEYPLLQKELTSKHPNSRSYNKAIKDKAFTKEEFRDRIFARLDVFAYEMAINLNTDYLIERVSLIVGDDINRIDELEINEIGADVLQRILTDLSTDVCKQIQPKGDHPFLAERGRIDHGFWRHADKTYSAYIDGYNTQASLDAWCQLNLHTRCPQSFIRWLKTYGNPKEIAEWMSYVA